MTAKLTIRFLPALALLVTSLLTAVPASAHCDTMAGPVVRAARRALDTGNVALALRWVRPEDEAEVTKAFDRARRARLLAPNASASTDVPFFETVVRLHRAGEGEPYTGLKDTAPEPALVAADKALENGDVTPLMHGLQSEQAAVVRERFARVRELSGRADESVAAGREYVHAYVEFIHFIESEMSGHGHAVPHQSSNRTNTQE